MAKSRARFLSELLGTTGLVKKSKSALAGADEVIDLSTLPSIPNSKLTNSSITINSSATSLGGSVTLGTDDVAEGSNLYYTDARADARVALIVDSAPGTLNTLNELAAALGDDANFSTTVTNSIATKLPLAGGTMTGAINAGANNISNINNATAVSFLSTNGYWVGGTQRMNGSGNLLNIGSITANGTLQLDGSFVIDTDTGNQPLCINRLSSTGTADTQSLRIHVNDSVAVFESEQDETDRYGGYLFTSKTSTNVRNRYQIEHTTGDSIWYNDAGTAKMLWDASEERLGINTTTPATTLDVNGAITSSAHTIYTQASTLEGINLVANVNSANQNSDSPKIQFNGEYQTNGPYIYGDNSGAYGYKSLKFYTNRNSATDYTTAPTVTLTLDSAGNAQFTGTLSSGAITSSGAIESTSLQTQNIYLSTALYTLNTAGNGWDSTINRNSGSPTANLPGGITSGNITTTGYLRGPSTFTIDPAAHGDDTGTVVIAGNLQVDGTTTTINSTTMTVDDLNLTLASGAANAAAANGAGITVDGASATITYDGTNDEWDFNKPTHVEVAGARVAEFGRTGAGTFDLTISDAGAGAAQLWFQAQTNDTGFNFRPKSSSGTNTNALYIAPDGKVGIANTGPAYLIDVGSAASTESNIFRGTVNGDFIFSLAKNATNLFSIRNNSTSIVHLNTQNNATLALGVSSTNNAGTIEHDVRIFSNGTMAMTASTAGNGSSIFSTGAYASGQGDNKTHLGYNTGSGYFNYVRGSNTVFSGLTQFDAGSTFNSSATFTAGNRPVVITGGAITMKGETGGWAFGLHAIGSSNTNHGGFGFLGGDDAFSYYYIGETYNAGNNFRLYKNGTLQVGSTTILDSNKNITNVGTATFSSTNSSVLTLNPTANNYGGITFQYNGAIKGLSMYNTGFMIFGGESGTDTRLQAGGQYAVSISNSSRNVSIGSTTSHPEKLYVNGNIRADGAYYVGGLAVIDSSRNITAGASITIDGDSVDPYLYIDGSTNNRDSGVKINAGGGYVNTLRMDSGNNLYIHNNAIHISSSGVTTVANVNNAYNLKVMAGSSNSWFGVYDDANDSANILVTRSNSVDSFRHLGHTGETTIKATGTGLRIESTNDEALQLVGSGTGLNFTSGTNNRIYFAGKRALEGNSAGTNLQLGEHYSQVTIQAAAVVHGNLVPNATNTYDLGSSNMVWRDLYIGDLNLNNETRKNDDGSTGNEVDGSTGNWTIQEGEEHLYIINNKNGKKYRFALEEIQ